MIRIDSLRTLIAILMSLLCAKGTSAAFSESHLPPAFKVLHRYQMRYADKLSHQILINRNGEVATSLLRWDEFRYTPRILFHSANGATHTDLPTDTLLTSLSFGNGGAVGLTDGWGGSQAFVSTPSGQSKRIFTADSSIYGASSNDFGTVGFGVSGAQDRTWRYDDPGPAQMVIDSFSRKGMLLIDNAGRIVQEHVFPGPTSSSTTRIMRLESPNVWRDLLSNWESDAEVRGLAYIDSLNEPGNAINASGDFVFSSLKVHDDVFTYSLNLFSGDDDQVFPIFSSVEPFSLRRLSVADNGDVFFSIDRGLSLNVPFLYRNNGQQLIDLRALVGLGKTLDVSTAMNRKGDLLLTIYDGPGTMADYSLLRAHSLTVEPLPGLSDLKAGPHMANLADDGTPYWWLDVGNNTFVLATTAVPEPIAMHLIAMSAIALLTFNRQPRPLSR